MPYELKASFNAKVFYIILSPTMKKGCKESWGKTDHARTSMPKPNEYPWTEALY